MPRLTSDPQPMPPATDEIPGPVMCVGCDENVANTIVYELPSGYLCDDCREALDNQDGVAVGSIRHRFMEVSTQ